LKMAVCTRNRVTEKNNDLDFLVVNEENMKIEYTLLVLYIYISAILLNSSIISLYSSDMDLKC
jgi:hypothetical protein